jgi:alkylation response protein AidB-like acyl-CoA dehydrogenase
MLYHHANDEQFETYSQVLEGLANILERNVVPHSSKIDEKKESLDPIRKEIFNAGLCQMPFATQYGGLGLPFSVYSLGIELAGAADASAVLSLAIHNTVATGIEKFGSEEQKAEWLPDLIAGRKLAAFGLTEASSGSDAGVLGTTAEPQGRAGMFRLKGSKMFITNAGEADLYMIFTRSPRGPTVFLVEKTTSGLSFGEDISKLGMRGSRTSEILLDCQVGSSSMLGNEGSGFDYAKGMLNPSRIVMAALCTGIAQVSMDNAVAYSRERRAFGQPISEFQLTKEKLADMATEISAARALYLYASSLRDSEEEFASEAAQAKVFATEMSLRVCDRSIQISGGYGYTSDDIHRHWRDARLLTIGEGTSEILRMLIARKELANAP